MSISIDRELQEIAGELNENSFAIPKGLKSHDCVAGYEKAIRGVNDFGYGEAIFGVMNFDDQTKRWWISNGAQASPIFFCPYCGLDLKTLFVSAA